MVAALEVKQLGVDGKTRIAIERAKQATRGFRLHGCFHERGGLTKAELARGMWLAEQKKQEEYM